MKTGPAPYIAITDDFNSEGGKNVARGRNGES